MNGTDPADADRSPHAHEPSFGPSAILTPANVITIARLLVAPVAFWMIIQQESSWPLWVLWALLTTTDSLDGYLARRQGTTRSGAFLDPLADKVHLPRGSLVATMIGATGRTLLRRLIPRANPQSRRQGLRS